MTTNLEKAINNAVKAFNDTLDKHGIRFHIDVDTVSIEPGYKTTKIHLFKVRDMF